jgi:hypothetical protein
LANARVRAKALNDLQIAAATGSRDARIHVPTVARQSDPMNHHQPCDVTQHDLPNPKAKTVLTR